MKNLIFLDIDGVMNDYRFIEKCYLRHHTSMNMQNVPFNPRSLRNLRLIWDSILDMGNEPEIVLSSTWRLQKEDCAIVNSRLAEYGMRFIHTTPYLNFRGQEILQWLDDNNYKDIPFIIIDDDIRDIEMFDKLKGHIIRTSFNEGLIGWKTQLAIENLQKQNKR